MDDLELTSALPVRSQLYAPEPIGVGTDRVESLASYLARLADSHFVSRTDLLVYLGADTANAVPPKIHRFYNLVSLSSRELNGMQQVARFWSSRVTKQTRHTNIEQLTLLPWCHLVTPRQLTSMSQCWCPTCLEEWRSTGQTLYWPLLWSVRAVTVCPFHQCSLEQHCPVCRAALPSLTVREPIGYCWKCKGWLGWRENLRPGQPATDISQSALQTAQEVLTLLAASSLSTTDASLEKLAVLLEHTMQESDCHAPTLARHLGLKPYILYRLLAHERLVSVSTLLGVLTSIGLDVNDFVRKSTAELMSSGCLNTFIGNLPSKRRTVHPRLRMGQRATPELLAEGKGILEAALDEDDPPPLKVLARHLGLTTVKVLRRHFPNLCQAILEKRRGHRNLDTLREHLTKILEAADIPASITTIASQLKTSPVTLHNYFPDEMARIQARRRIISDEEQFRSRVAAFLEIEPPISLSEVSHRLGIKTHHIRQHCPDLRQAIVQRFAAYKHLCATERTRHRATAVREAVVKLNAEGQFPSKTKVAALLGRTPWALLHKSESEVFSAVMHELGLSPR